MGDLFEGDFLSREKEKQPVEEIDDDFAESAESVETEDFKEMGGEEARIFWTDEYGKYLKASDFPENDRDWFLKELASYLSGINIKEAESFLMNIKEAIKNRKEEVLFANSITTILKEMLNLSPERKKAIQKVAILKKLK